MVQEPNEEHGSVQGRRCCRRQARRLRRPVPRLYLHPCGQGWKVDRKLKHSSPSALNLFSVKNEKTPRWWSLVLIHYVSSYHVVDYIILLLFQFVIVFNHCFYVGRVNYIIFVINFKNVLFKCLSDSLFWQIRNVSLFSFRPPLPLALNSTFPSWHEESNEERMIFSTASPPAFSASLSSNWLSFHSHLSRKRRRETLEWSS